MAYVQKIVIPHVTSLVFREVHPKFVIASLRAFHLPHLAALDLDYNIDHNQTDPRVLLRMLVATARPLLSRLTEFQTSYEMHCHDPDAIARLCEALPNVTHFRLHYWGDLYECEEWWDVLRVQWEHVAAHPEALSRLSPYLPRLRRLHTCGLSVPRLRGLLDIARGLAVLSWRSSTGWVLFRSLSMMASKRSWTCSSASRISPRIRWQVRLHGMQGAVSTRAEGKRAVMTAAEIDWHIPVSIAHPMTADMYIYVVCRVLCYALPLPPYVGYSHCVCHTEKGQQLVKLSTRVE